MSNNTKDKPGVEPEFRFPEFRASGAWRQESFADKTFATIHKGKGISKADIVEGGATPCIRYGELYTRYGEVINSVFSYTDVSTNELFFSKKNDVIIPSSGETKIDIAVASCVNLDGVALGGDLNVIRSTANGNFLSYYVNGPLKNEIAKVAQGDSVVHLYPSQLEKIRPFVPSPDEQRKIAACLYSLDNLIEAEIHKLSAMECHQKGLIQELFPAQGESIPKRRFPEFKDAPEWEVKNLGELAQRVNKRNKGSLISRVFTNSAAVGVVDQREYFDKDIANKNNVENYYIIEKGDFVYNPRVSAAAPVGPISRNNIDRGIMSPLYTIFRFNDKNSDFYYHYFKSNGWHSFIKNTSNTGARFDRVSITIDQFMALPLPYPSPKEQRKIATCLLSLEELIAAQGQAIEAIKMQKKGLMQGLFPAMREVA